MEKLHERLIVVFEDKEQQREERETQLDKRDSHSKLKEREGQAGGRKMVGVCWRENRLIFKKDWLLTKRNTTK